MAVDGVIFDWGGTLSIFASVDLFDMWELAAAHLAEATGRDAAELQSRLHEAEAAFWRRCDETWDSSSLGELMAAESAALGLDVTAAVLEEAATRHLDAWTPHVKHHGDAGAALEKLRSRGVRIGMLSNTHWPRHFHEHFLERDGLVDLIDLRAYTSEMPKVKPDPSVFRFVLDGLGLAPEQTVFVGDRPVDDIWGAQQSGMRAIWRPHPASPPLLDVVPEAVIERLADLPDLLAGW